MKKCTHGKRQNESFNNVIWSYVPKTVFVGTDTLKLVVWGGVITFNSGHLGRVKVLQKLLQDSGPNCIVGLQMLDSKHIKKS